MGEVVKTCLVIKIPHDAGGAATVALHEIRDDGSTAPISDELPWGVQYTDIDCGFNYGEKDGWLTCERNGDGSIIIHLKRWRGSHINPYKSKERKNEL